MSEDIETLERRREELYRQVAEVGDFRRGIISLNYRKCGKKNCVCAAAEHAGHSQYLWNTTIKGKSYAKCHFSAPFPSSFFRVIPQV